MLWHWFFSPFNCIVKGLCKSFKHCVHCCQNNLLQIHFCDINIFILFLRNKSKWFGCKEQTCYSNKYITNDKQHSQMILQNHCLFNVVGNTDRIIAYCLFKTNNNVRSTTERQHYIQCTFSMWNILSTLKYCLIMRIFMQSVTTGWCSRHFWLGMATPWGPRGTGVCITSLLCFPILFPIMFCCLSALTTNKINTEKLE